MNKNFPVIFVGVLLVLFIGGCAQQPSGKTFSDSTAFNSGLYTVSLPSSWEVEEHESFVYFRPPLVSDDDKIQGNVVIYAAPAKSENQTLIDFFQASVNGLIETTPEFTLIGHKEETISSTPAYRIVYTVSKGSEITQYLQVFTLKGGNTYIITYAAPQEAYTKNVGNVEEMIRSFKIK